MSQTKGLQMCARVRDFLIACAPSRNGIVWVGVPAQLERTLVVQITKFLSLVHFCRPIMSANVRRTGSQTEFTNTLSTWVKEVLTAYPSLTFSNFTTSWQNGYDLKFKRRLCERILSFLPFFRNTYGYKCFNIYKRRF